MFREKGKQCLTKRGGDLRIPAAILILALLLIMSACGEQTQEVVATDDDTLTAMSFNVYVSDQTAKRRESVLQTILNYMPDTIGVQEADAKWMRYLRKHLGDFYNFAGTGREGGTRGERCAILYRSDRFELVETDTKWLSDTPDMLSKYEDSNYYRIYTYAILKDKATGREIVAVNTHLDNSNQTVRQKQWTVLLGELEQFKDYPIILSGDFNSIRGGLLYKEIVELFSDSYKIAAEVADGPTLLNGSMRVIDFIFVNDQIAEVLDYRVIAEKINDVQPSDHAAVLIEYRLADAD